MKNIFIIITILFSVNLFALSKSASVPDYAESTTNFSSQFRDNSSGCSSKKAEFDGYAPAVSNVTNNASASLACSNVNPDTNKLKILKIDKTDTYSGSPNCTPFYASDADKRDGISSYSLYFVVTSSLSCQYECKNKNTPPDNSGDYIFDDDTCEWHKPCTDKVPDGWIDYPMSEGSCVAYSDLTDAQKQIYPMAGSNICGSCFAPPYDVHNCTSPSVLDTSSGVAKCITPACPSGQFLDANSTCQDLSFPDGFPSDKGHQVIKEDGNNFTPSSCVPGKVFKTGIAYAKVIGWNSEKKVCEVAAFFCDSGLTFDASSNTCVPPSDTKTFDPNKNEISQALADACTSGKWAKKWTLNYCNQPLCYIGLNEQNYNLHCGNMYFEYDCTSDYRLRKYVQVSCGEPLNKDKNTTSLIIGDSSTSGSADGNATSGSGAGSNYVPDLNTTTTNLNVVSAINSASSGLSNSISALDSHVLGASSKLGSIDGKLSSIASDVGSIKDALHAGDDKVGDLDNITNSNGSGSFDNLVKSVKGYIGLLKSNFNEVQGLLSNGFSFSAPVGNCINPNVSVYGKDIELNICQPLATFHPIVYFLTVIGFTVLSIKIFLLGFAL